MIILCTERFITSDLLKVVPSQSAIRDVSVLYLFRSWYSETCFLAFLVQTQFGLIVAWQCIVGEILSQSVNSPRELLCRNCVSSCPELLRRGNLAQFQISANVRLNLWNFLRLLTLLTKCWYANKTHVKILAFQ